MSRWADGVQGGSYINGCAGQSFSKRLPGRLQLRHTLVEPVLKIFGLSHGTREAPASSRPRLGIVRRNVRSSPYCGQGFFLEALVLVIGPGSDDTGGLRRYAHVHHRLQPEVLSGPGFMVDAPTATRLCGWRRALPPLQFLTGLLAGLDVPSTLARSARPPKSDTVLWVIELRPQAAGARDLPAGSLAELRRLAGHVLRPQRPSVAVTLAPRPHLRGEVSSRSPSASTVHVWNLPCLGMARSRDGTTLPRDNREPGGGAVVVQRSR